MAKVMLLVLVGESGATLAESRMTAGEDERALQEALCGEARVSGFSREEIALAKIVVVGEF